MDQNDHSAEQEVKQNSFPDSAHSDSNSNSNNPTFRIESEGDDGNSENRRNGHSPEKNEPTTSNDKDGINDASQHLTVSPKEPRMQRSSSLKTQKQSSEEGSCHKKIVRFADALGLDLVDVKIFKNDEGSIPNIPICAFNDLKVSLDSVWTTSSEIRTKTDPTQDKYVLIPQFEQPGCNANFINKVKDQKVCLENVVIYDLKMIGIVRIANLHYKKSVLVRYTTDDWKTELEEPAKYVEGSSDVVTDKFTFILHPRHMTPGDKLTFVVKYEVLDQEFWDNNNCNNYILLCKEKNDQLSTSQ